MNIYEQISKNKIRTFFIIILFSFILSGFFYVVGLYFHSPRTYFLLGFAIAFVSSFGSYFWSDKLVLSSTHAHPATKEEYFDFYTVVENLSIAAGTPMPRLYVIDDPSPNAFATGRNPKHAVVCATTGLLSMMDRAELEGVIGHELSHVKNYDILLTSIVAVLVGTLALAADWISRSLWWGFGDEERENRNPLLFALLIISLILAPLAATLIQLAVSRRREYLADASGALLTRNPNELASALEKIAKYPRPVATAGAQTAHLFITNPFKDKKTRGFLVNLFNTHPPIEERIRILRSM